ncbi:MAG TPA: TM0106 family RecB-like putative nuclease [Candidatus Limnocylindrales bacterium]|nr:TM0106 family RecB-like putative nuclease [Candidatus Limnocylindrales bacterium]
MQSLDGRIVLSPSDLNDHVECPHLTTLALEVVRGERARPHVPDQQSDLLRQKGELHERAHLEKLRASGRTIVEISLGRAWEFEAAAARTVEAMRAGADVISQATFVDGRWRGRADFLLKVARATKLGAWGYEALDAKLARSAKPTYVLQLCFYSDRIAAIQGLAPERMHVLLGIGEERPLRYDDFVAYYRRVRGGFEAAIDGDKDTEPDPVDHCGLCEFREVCDERWRREDHLVQVAGIRRDHVEILSEAGLSTMTALAAAAPGRVVAGLTDHAYETLRDQAELQRRPRAGGALPWHTLAVEAERGFALLPRPSAGDVIFDIEGDPFWEPARGLHFLFGLLLRDGADWEYRQMWGHDRAGERRLLEGFVDLVRGRLARDPAMHVYHYGAYEKAAVTDLMGRYATREDEVDDLLRRKVFVNLHTVVRQGLRAGVSSYSLKEIESLAEFTRIADVTSGTRAVLAYEGYREDGDVTRLDRIAAYNEEDCRATLALRDWLVAHRPSDASWAGPVELDLPVEPPTGEREALRFALTDGEEAGTARWLAGELLEYHRREARPAWWWFFDRCDRMTLEDLVEDAESIGDLTPRGAGVPEKRSLVYTFQFPPQQYKLGPGDQPVDPATKKAAGTITALDDATGTLKLRRGLRAGGPVPRSLIPPRPFDTREQRGALARLATAIRDGDRRYRALHDILARTPPRVRGRTSGAVVQAIDIDEQRRIAEGLDDSYLFIQGPPGTGKTWTGARLITHLMRRGRRVGVAATSHKAIHNLLAAVEEAAGEERVSFRGLKKASGDNRESYYEGTAIGNATDVADFAKAGAGTLLFAGTAWLFADARLAGGVAPLVDTLVIDEAGQVSLADALAMGTVASNVILLGDPLQLAQVSQGTHPQGTERSVLEHLLGTDVTIPPHMGLFLERTRRMHPDVCRFISEVVYESRLEGIPEMARQGTAFGTGLRWRPVEHRGNASASTEEAAVVAAEIRRMMGGEWTDQEGTVQPLGPGDFVVVAPYNAQVRRLREALEGAGLGAVPVGTVDKFQGREAPVVFYSMATSSAEDVPRTLEFLFSRNRLNVAVSRARCLAILVASPLLLESRARTIEQMRLINALCRFVDLAEILT